jgi:hypothetical protein
MPKVFIWDDPPPKRWCMGRTEGVRWGPISSGPSNPPNGTLCPSLGRGQDLPWKRLLGASWRQGRASALPSSYPTSLMGI